MAEVKNRNEIEEKYKWCLEDIFSSENEWEKAAGEVVRQAESLSEMTGKVTDSAENLFSVLSALDEIGESLLSIVAYACMRRDEDNGVSKYRAMADRCGDIESEVASQLSFVEPELVEAGQKKIAEFNEAYKNNYRQGEEGAEHIAVIVMNPNNGDILAMANYPNYDLNNPRDLSLYYSESEIAAMDEETKLETLNELWQNFCVYYTYEPGSTAKAFTIATGLETGTVSEGDVYECNGYEMIPGYSKPIRCVNRNGHGMETLKDALMDSCNDALMQMAYRIR